MEYVVKIWTLFEFHVSADWIINSGPEHDKIEKKIQNILS